jgi:Leucine-rich repeat (LRR) protein
VQALQKQQQNLPASSFLLTHELCSCPASVIHGIFMHSSKIKKLFGNYLELHFIFQELVLRDNKLTKIPVASIFKGLLVFDVSFNEISSLSGLANVSSTLKELYVSKNEVAKMEELEHFHALEILELGSNRLRVRNLE